MRETTPRSGEINGKKVKYSDYYEVYEQIKSQTNATEETEQQQDELSDMAWQELIASRVYIPGFEKMGLQTTDTERKGGDQRRVLLSDHGGSLYQSPHRSV